MLYTVLKTLHVLAIVVWVGGMFFAYVVLRPAVETLDVPLRLRLMRDVFARFFKVVMAVSVLTLVTGVWMLGRVAKQTVQAGGNFEMPLAWTVMAALGILMFVIFLVIRYRFFKNLEQAVVNDDVPAGAQSLKQIRRWVGVNLFLGVLVIVVTLTAY